MNTSEWKTLIAKVIPTDQTMLSFHLHRSEVGEAEEFDVFVAPAFLFPAGAPAKSAHGGLTIQGPAVAAAEGGVQPAPESRQFRGAEPSLGDLDDGFYGCFIWSVE
jgi:hypothetical protein